LESLEEVRCDKKQQQEQQQQQQQVLEEQIHSAWTVSIDMR
jgi:hypothetical protein